MNTLIDPSQYLNFTEPEKGELMASSYSLLEKLDKAEQANGIVRKGCGQHMSKFYDGRGWCFKCECGGTAPKK